jgi:cytochrome c oxidase subunit II
VGALSVETPRPERPQAQMSMGRMAIVGTIVSALGIALALTIHWFPVSASRQAKPIDTLWDVILIISVPIFVFVQTYVLFCVWKFRMRPGEELLDGPPIHGNTRLEVIWTAIPATLLVALCTYAYLVLTDIEQAKANTFKVRVVGEQFAWTFFYPTGNGREAASPQLYLPVNQPVEFTLQSKDVVHDFWVPAFRVKKDAVPGINTSYRVTTTRPGDFPVICAELCGLGHATMRSDVHVLPRPQFNQWFQRLRSGRQPGAGGGAAPAPAGGGGAVNAKQVFNTAGCSGCHTLAEAGAHGTVGPNLDKGLKGKSAAFIRQSIVDPNAVITPGYSGGVMPQNFKQTLPPAQLNAVVSYLAKVTSK